MSSPEDWLPDRERPPADGAERFARLFAGRRQGEMHPVGVGLAAPEGHPADGGPAGTEGRIIHLGPEAAAVTALGNCYAAAYVGALENGADPSFARGTAALAAMDFNRVLRDLDPRLALPLEAGS